MAGKHIYQALTNVFIEKIANRTCETNFLNEVGADSVPNVAYKVLSTLEAF